MQITADDRGFIYQDDGHGVRDMSDFEALLKPGESGWDQSIEASQNPMGLGVHALLTHEEVESVIFSSNLLSLTLDARRWRTDFQYAAGWADNLNQICFPSPGLTIGVMCSRALSEQLVNALTDGWQSYRSSARGYHDLLNIEINGKVVDTSVQEDTMPSTPLIEASNKLTDFIRDSLFEYFSRTQVEEIDPLALMQFYHDYPEHASKLPCFVAARRKRYESGDDVSKIISLFSPQVLSYENPPLLLDDKARVVWEGGTVNSVEYGLHTFLELTGAAYKVMEADESRLDIRRLWTHGEASIRRMTRDAVIRRCRRAIASRASAR